MDNTTLIPSSAVEVMIDIETLGKNPGSVIISLGAVKFDNHVILDRFYARIDAQSCVDCGLKMDASTVLWWMKQEDAARAEFAKPSQHLAQVLLDFSHWFGPTSLPVWGNGASFDNVLLSDAYAAANISRPWEYHHDRCYRTIKAASSVPKPKPIGILHNAVDDAGNQALHLIAIRAHDRKILDAGTRAAHIAKRIYNQVGAGDSVWGSYELDYIQDELEEACKFFGIEETRNPDQKELSLA